jgi:chemotaxis signal transduction protein
MVNENVNDKLAGLTVNDVCDIVRMSREESHAPENFSARSTIMGPLSASQKCSAEKIAGISAMRGIQAV